MVYNCTLASMGSSGIYLEIPLEAFFLELLCSFVLACSIDLLCIMSAIHSRTRWPCVFSGNERYIVQQISIAVKCLRPLIRSIFSQST